jgi:hypothetical protein
MPQDNAELPFGKNSESNRFFLLFNKIKHLIEHENHLKSKLLKFMKFCGQTFLSDHDEMQLFFGSISEFKKCLLIDDGDKRATQNIINDP